jgi:general L-amino acid transport system permease protein
VAAFFNERKRVMAANQPSIQKTSIPFYRDERVLKAIAQIVSAVLIIGFIIWALVNFFQAAEARNMTLTFGFLNEAAGFPISNPPIEYEPSMSFGRAFMVGVINTILVSILGIIFASIMGTLIALARLSSNWLLNRLALAYIEFHRNIPLLVLLFMWYFVAFGALPAVKESIALPGPIYINMRGFYFGWAQLTEEGLIFAISVVVGVVAAIIAFVWLRRVRANTGKSTHYMPISLGLLIIIPLIGWFASGGQPLEVTIPVLEGFNYQGGMRFTPEFAALLVGLTTYTAAFIAEVVRAGIQAVNRGQIEAARALGLSTTQVLSLVVMPQALRVIIPPMISQYLNLTKNSSLALAIGFQEVFSVGKIAINQAGRAVPVFALVMITYLVLSLLTSFALNLYNRRIQFVTR